jgi:hypothetical protein
LGNTLRYCALRPDVIMLLDENARRVSSFVFGNAPEL